MESLSWPANSFDAIRLILVKGKIEMAGDDNDQVVLRGDIRSYTNIQKPPEVKDRWLLLDQLHQYGDITLQLPASKPWVLDIVSYHSDIKIRNIMARIRYVQGKGDLEIESCRGKFQLFATHGNIKINHFRELEINNCPPPPGAPVGLAPQGMEEWVGNQAEFGRQFSDFSFWDDHDWAGWSGEVAEKAKGWAGQVSHQFMGHNWRENLKESQIRLVKGDIELEDVETIELSGGINHGQLKFKEGEVKDIHFRVNHGDIEIDSVLPTGNWDIGAGKGNIKFKFLADTQTRLDVATRDGEIKSDISLVRVARPGPEARRGARMVGNIGQAGADGKTNVNFSTSKGDIQIEMLTYQRQVKTWQGQRGENRPVIPLGPSTNENKPDGAQTIPVVSANPMVQKGTTDDNSKARLHILRALNKGEITVEEADLLLRRLEL